MSKGLFITFEGPDGSGKTTQIQELKKYLEKNGFNAIITREPGGTPIGEKIRQIILDKNNQEMDYVTEALLYAASRAQHVSQVIKPALEQGRMVICDRFMDSSIVYQGYGRKLGDSVRIMNEIAVRDCLPDVTFLLKINPGIGKSRIEEGEQDRLELEKMEYHNEVYRGYMELSKQYPERIICIDAGRSIEEIRIEICKHMDSLLVSNSKR